MTNPIDELVKATEELSRSAKVAWSLLVSGEATFNLQADTLNRAIAEIDHTLAAVREQRKGVEPVNGNCGICGIYVLKNLHNFCPSCGTLIARKE